MFSSVKVCFLLSKMFVNCVLCVEFVCMIINMFHGMYLITTAIANYFHSSSESFLLYILGECCKAVCQVKLLTTFFFESMFITTLYNIEYVSQYVFHRCLVYYIMSHILMMITMIITLLSSFLWNERKTFYPPV